MPIEEIDKSAGTWCRFCNIGVGCAVYTQRPESCVGFRCEWLNGVGEETERPDILGIIFDLLIVPVALPEGILRIWELDEGRIDGPVVEQVTRVTLEQGRWVSQFPLGGQKKLFVPPGKNVTRATLRSIRAAGFRLAL